MGQSGFSRYILVNAESWPLVNNMLKVIETESTKCLVIQTTNTGTDTDTDTDTHQRHKCTHTNCILLHAYTYKHTRKDKRINNKVNKVVEGIYGRTMRLRPRRTHLVTERTKMKDKDEHYDYG